MANEDKQPVLQGQYRQDQIKLVDGMRQELDGLEKRIGDRSDALETALAGKYHRDDFLPVAGELADRLGALEKAISGHHDMALPTGSAKIARQQGKGHVPLGETVLFRPHDGSGPKGGWPAIVCDHRFQREGFPAVYALWVLEPRRQRWEENIKEGDAAGTFTVR